MKISIAATNPCHVWDFAVELHHLGGLSAYYSGYPGWKLRGSKGLPVRSHSLRTLVTYALHGRVPERFRPSNQALFRWQDESFDRWVARVLKPADFHHGIPGQCREAFRRAKEMGIRTVLNHATGPARQVAKLLQPEYARLGLSVAEDGGYDAEDWRRIDEEFELADFHCCASSVVRDQLVAEGVSQEKIWVAPYGADPQRWHPGEKKERHEPGETFRILFAGQVSVRKGLRFLLQALEQAGDRPWRLDVFGPLLDETARDRAAYRGNVPVAYHGPVSQERLAQAMRDSNLLVLPSLEEGFGLVVVQALACGLPCAVSSMVGAKDLIRHRENGSIFASMDSASLADELEYWAGHFRPVSGNCTWDKPTRELLIRSEESLAKSP